MTPSPVIPYAFPVRALRRWSTEHLRLAPAPEDEIEAVFTLEGSTCGNVPLTLLYLVRLGPASEGWPIRRLYVGPAPHDDGHRQQCAYRSDADQLWRELQQEQPCHGEPLAAVLAWSPDTSPAGCLCTSPSRAHKWRIVLHTLHYALTHGSSLAAL
jgi:hypothetical protein